MKPIGLGLPRFQKIIYGIGPIVTWLLTPTGNPNIFERYVWDDNAVWDDNYYYTD